MSVRRIRSSWWVDFRAAGVRHRLRSPDNTRAGAHTYEVILRQRLARGEPVVPAATTATPPCPTLAEFAAEWLRTWVPCNAKPSTAEHKASVMRSRVLPAFGHLRLDAIDSRRIEQSKATWLAAGRSFETINQYLAALRACLRTAVEWGLLPTVPPVRWMRKAPLTASFLTAEEVERLIAAAEPSVCRDMVIVGLYTGLRFGEMTALDWSDVDLAARRLTVRRNLVRGVLGTPKNNRVRFIPITERVHGVLAARQRHRGLVFTHHENAVTHGAALHMLHRSCRRADLERCSWHRLRHTFASRLVELGAPLPAVQQLLGHSNIAMTMRYAHVAPSLLEWSIGVLDRHRDETFGQPVGNAALGAALRGPVPAADTVGIPLNRATTRAWSAHGEGDCLK